MKIVNNIALVMLSFLIALFSFASITSLILSMTFSNSDFMLSILNDHKYYDNIYTEYSEELESLAIPAGIDEGVLTAIIPKDEFSKKIDEIVVASYTDDSNYSGNLFDRAAVYERFYNGITDYFTNVKGVEIIEEMHEGLDNVASLCATTCEVYVIFPFIDTLGSYSIEFNKYFELGAIVSAVGFVLMVVLLCITRKWRKFSLYIVSMSLVSSGFMLIAAPLYVILTGKIRYINVEIRSIYDFAVGYAERLLYSFITVGILICIIAVIVAVVTYFIRKCLTKAKENSAIAE